MALKLHQLVVGADTSSSQSTALFIVPPVVSTAALPLALAFNTGSDLKQHLTVYQCDTDLTCTKPLLAFPADVSQPRVRQWPTPSTIIIRLFQGVQGDNPQFWRSTDGDRTFAPWASVNTVIASVETKNSPLPTYAAIAVNPALPQVVCLQVHGSPGPYFKWARNAPPAEELFRSNDGGRTWQRVGCQRELLQPGPAGTLPWSSAGSMALAPDGRLLVARVSFPLARS